MKQSTLLYRITYHSSRFIFFHIFRGQVTGTHHIPSKDGFILAGNHLSFLDPPMLGCCLGRSIAYFSRATLFRHKIMQWALPQLNCIPIKRDAEADVSGLKMTLKTLKSGEGLMFFPEGTRSRDGKLQKPKKGVGLIAAKTRVPIVPARIRGAFDILSRNTALPDFSHTLQISYGKPLLPADYDPGKENPRRYEIISERIMEAIANLETPPKREEY